MFRIFADTFKTAARQKDWDAPDLWRYTDQRPMPDHATRADQMRQMRRWMRDTGIM